MAWIINQDETEARFDGFVFCYKVTRGTTTYEQVTNSWTVRSKRKTSKDWTGRFHVRADDIKGAVEEAVKRRWNDTHCLIRAIERDERELSLIKRVIYEQV